MVSNNPLNKCSQCDFFRKNHTGQLTEKELYDRDTRTPTSSYWKYWWNRSKYKIELYQDAFDRMEDTIILYNRECGRCIRYPKSVGVHKDYSCGEFVLKNTETY